MAARKATGRAPAGAVKTKAGERSDRWTRETQERFFEQLAATVNVAASLRAVGMSAAGAYKARGRSAQFRAAWDAALEEGYQRLEFVLLERAINGMRKPLYRGGEQVGETIEHDNRTALTLLARRDLRHGVKPASEASETVRERFRAKIEAMAARLAGEGE